MTQKSTAILRVTPHRSIIPRLAWFEPILTMFAVRKTRIDLSLLTDKQLQDIGLCRDEAEAEIKRAIWDVPPHWRHRSSGTRIG